ncbi:MAG: T9SS type A sorting domain-containing protein, partial [Chitinophagaceae bacterium]
DIANAIALDVFGSIYVTGQSSNDYLTVKYNSNGTQSWAVRYDGPGNDLDNANSIAVYNHPGPAFILPSVYVTGDSYGIGTNYDITTIKYEQPLVIGRTPFAKEEQLQTNLYTAQLSVAPNPLRGTGKIIYEITENSYVTLEVFDATGRKISTIFSGERAKGKYVETLNAARLSNGTYTCRMIANNGRETVKKSVSVVLEE